MAARPQRRSVYGPNRPQMGVRPVYEDFKPDTEWEHEEQSDILLIQLPGFSKEHLKVSMEGTATLRIRGERLVGGNKWSHFEEVVTIPEECNRSGIRAKYEQGILTITMPKIHKGTSSVPQPDHKQETEAKTTTTKQEALAAPETSSDKKPKSEKSLADQSSSDHKRKVDHQEPQSKKQKYEDVQEEGEYENARKSLSEHFSSEQEKATNNTSKLLPKPDNKGQDQPPLTETWSGDTAKQHHDTGNTHEKESADHKDDLDSIKTPENVNNDSVKDETEETGGRAALITDAKVTEPESISSTGVGASTTPAGLANGFKFEKYMQAVKDKLSKRTELNEERQLMMNVGTAVLVIVGLGAYLSYTTGGLSG